MSLTLFEGPDGAGKTTLIEAWRRRREGVDHGRSVKVSAHGPYPDADAERLTNVYLADCVAALRGVDVLMDRSWLSEEIYGPVMRNGNRISVPARRMLERVALAASAIVVRCLPPFEVCRKNYLSRRHLEYLGTDHHLRVVYDLYCKQRCDLQSVIFNYTRENSKIAFADVVEHARGPKNAGPGVGAFRSGVTLLVGEQVSEPTAAASLPFVSADPNGCTAWLSQRLEEWGVPESSLYWVNALTVRGNATEGGPWLDLLRPRRTIAMGAVARQWCLDNALACEAIPHPQYWRRFNHNQPYPLRELLQ
jgi:hypothetical protein